MLNEYKEIYKLSAKEIPNYKKLSQMELINKYLEGGPLAENYLSALILRYWHIIDRTLLKDKGLYDATEAYDWYLNAIIYAIKNRPWEKESSSIYKDERSIEKILNVHFKCLRANWFQASNRYKRKINHSIYSLDNLIEDYGDHTLKNEYPKFLEQQSDIEQIEINEVITKYFEKGYHITAFTIDSLVNDIINPSKNKVELCQQIKKAIKTLDNSYLKNFSIRYKLNFNKVYSAYQQINKLNDLKLIESIQYCVYTLRNSYRGIH